MIPLRVARVYRTAGGWYTTGRDSLRFKVMFCGSDLFSVESLRAVLDAKDVWSHVHVLCPDVKMVGRGGKHASRVEQKCALMRFAEENELPVTTVSQLQSVAPQISIYRGDNEKKRGFPEETWTPPSPFDTNDPSHLLLTASFGHIIPNSLLERFDASHRLNVHPSLLPQYRGAAPIQWTILNGDKTTGMSVQRLVERGRGIDAGDIVGVIEDIPVPADATFPSMMRDLAPMGGELLVKVLREMRAGTNVARPQDASKISRAPKINKDSTVIDWDRHDALAIERMHRALSYKSPVHTESRSLFLMDPEYYTDELPSSVQQAADSVHDIRCGTAFLDKESKDSWRLFVACNGTTPDQRHSWLVVRTIKKGLKAKSVKDWWNGLRDAKGQKFVKLE